MMKDEKAEAGTRRMTTRSMRRSNTRKRTTNRSKKATESDQVTINGNIIVDFSDVDHEHTKIITDLLKTIIGNDISDEIAVVDKVVIQSNIRSESTVIPRYTIMVVWEGSKPFDGDYLKEISEYKSKPNVMRFQYTINSDTSNVEMMKKALMTYSMAGVKGDDTRHRAALLGLKSVLSIYMTISKTNQFNKKRKKEIKNSDNHVPKRRLSTNDSIDDNVDTKRGQNIGLLSWIFGDG